MKVFVFLVSFALFVGGMALCGFAFGFGDPWNTGAFVGGIAAISISLAIPFHLLSRADA